MRYIDVGVPFIPKNCKYGPRSAEGIILTYPEWCSVTDHLIRNEREKSVSSIQKQKEEAKKETSLLMTKNWSNTLASVKTLSDRKRIEKREREKQDKVDKYNEILKSRKEEKNRILVDVRKILYEAKDSSKTIKSGIFYSVVLQERLKQIEKKKAFKVKKQKEEAEMKEKLKKQAEEFFKEKLNEKKIERNKKLLQKCMLDEQMKSLKMKKKLRLEEFQEEKRDLIKMKLEEEKVRNCDLLEKMNQKRFAIKYFTKGPAQLEFEAKLALEEEEENELNNIYNEYATKFRKARKEREQKLLNDKIDHRIKMAEKLALKLAEAEKERNAKLDESIKESYFGSETRDERKMFEEILKQKKEDEERFARNQYEAKEAVKWEMIQLCRSFEISDQWKKYAKEQKRNQQLKTRAEFDAQCIELNERRAEELKESLVPFELETYEDDMNYIAEAMEIIKKCNLPSYPILAAIAKVKKMNGAWNEEQNKANMMEENKSLNKKTKQELMGSGCYCLK